MNPAHYSPLTECAGGKSHKPLPPRNQRFSHWSSACPVGRTIVFCSFVVCPAAEQPSVFPTPTHSTRASVGPTRNFHCEDVTCHTARRCAIYPAGIPGKPVSGVYYKAATATRDVEMHNVKVNGEFLLV